MPKGGYLFLYIDPRSQCDSLVILCRLDPRDFAWRMWGVERGRGAVVLKCRYCKGLHRSSSDGNHMYQKRKTEIEIQGRCIVDKSMGEVIARMEWVLGMKKGWASICLCHVNQGLRTLSLLQGQNGPWLSSISVSSSHYHRGSTPGEASKTYPIYMEVR